MTYGTAPGLAPPLVGKNDPLFKDWMRKVDAFLIRLAGLDHRDLDDAAYWRWYDDGVGPRTAARIALKAAKENSGC